MQKHLFYLFIIAAVLSCCRKDTASGIGKVKDYDGNLYDTAVIGTQTWMVENLKTTHYRNGVPIPYLTDSAEWANDKNGAYCDYNNSAGNGNTYGHLYNWYAVNNSDSLCPFGWHIATDSEWHVLATYLGNGYVAGGAYGAETGAGGAMKSTSLWDTPNNATNSSGFTALPGGTRSYSGTFFSNSNTSLGPLGEYGIFWSSTKNAGAAFGVSLVYINPDLEYTNNYFAVGLSCRCVKN